MRFRARPSHRSRPVLFSGWRRANWRSFLKWNKGKWRMENKLSLVSGFDRTRFLDLPVSMLHSYLNASMGWILAARCAGISRALNPTPPITRVTRPLSNGLFVRANRTDARRPATRAPAGNSGSRRPRANGFPDVEVPRTAAARGAMGRCPAGPRNRTGSPGHP